MRTLSDTDLVNQLLADGALMLTVSRRLARHWSLRHAHWQQQQSATAWGAPHILTWTAWLMQLHELALDEGSSERAVLSAEQQRQRWMKIIREDAALQLLDPALAVRGAQGAWALEHEWHVLPASGSQARQEEQAYARWSASYRKWCQAEALSDQAALAQHLRLDIGPAELDLPKQVIFAGFSPLTPEQRAWQRALAEQGVSLYEFAAQRTSVTLLEFSAKDDQTEWHCIASQARTLLEQDASKRIGVMVPELAQRREEVMRVFDRVFFPLASPSEIDKIGRPYELSHGSSLLRQPLIEVAVLSLELLLARLQGPELSRWLLSPRLSCGVPRDVAPELRQARERAARSSRESFDRHLRRHRIFELGVGRLIRALQPRTPHAEQDAGGDRAWLSRALEEAQRRRPDGQQGLAEWAASFSHVLAALDWPGSGLGSTDFQVLKAWNAVLDELVALDDGEAHSFRSALEQLRRMLRETVFQVQGRDVPVQVLGRLETRGLEFDTLYLSGMDTRHWPAHETVNPWLPRDAQQAQGVPAASVAVRLALAGEEAKRWLNQAETVVISHAQTQEDQPAHLSPVLESLLKAVPEVIPQEPVSAVSMQWPSLMELMRGAAAQLALESVEDFTGPVPQRQGMVRVRGGSGRFERQSLCPFRGYAAGQLGLEGLEEVQPGLDQRDHGTLVHEVLELFWGTVKSKTQLDALSQEALEAEVDRCVEQAIEGLDFWVQNIERRRTRALILEWLAHEKTRPRNFIVREREWRLPVRRWGLEFNLQIDRIDELVDGAEPEWVVIDYKTGGSDGNSAWRHERLRKPQLPLYALLLEQRAEQPEVVQGQLDLLAGLDAEDAAEKAPHITAIAFARVISNQPRFAGVRDADKDDPFPSGRTVVKELKIPKDESLIEPGADEDEVEFSAENGTETLDWEAMRKRWATTFETLAGEIREGVATVTPQPNACTWCPLSSVCRIRLDNSGDERDEFQMPPEKPYIESEA